MRHEHIKDKRRERLNGYKKQLFIMKMKKMGWTNQLRNMLKEEGQIKEKHINQTFN